MGGLLLCQKFATERVKYLDVVLIPRSNLYKSNIEGPGHMPRTSPPNFPARLEINLCLYATDQGFSMFIRNGSMHSCNVFLHFFT